MVALVQVTVVVGSLRRIVRAACVASSGKIEDEV